MSGSNGIATKKSKKAGGMKSRLRNDLLKAQKARVKAQEKKEAHTSAKGEVPRIVIMPPKFETLRITVKAVTRLVTHGFGEHPRESLRSRDDGKKVTRKKRDREAEYQSALHRLTTKVHKPGKAPSGVYGFPAVGFKAGMASAGQRYFNLFKTVFNGSVWVTGVDHADFVTIQCPKGFPVMREDMVKLKGVNRASEMRYRPDFEENWRVVLLVEFNADVMDAGSVVNLLAHAGHSVGIGEWRPEKGGNWGKYAIEKIEEII